jgi:small-conductance mechanosensitive channel
MMEFLEQLLARILQVFGVVIFTPAGGSPVTVRSILTGLLVFVLLIVATGQVQKRFLRPVFGRTPMSPGMQSAAIKITGYVILVLGTLVVLQSVGINLTTLNVLAGAVGIGVGFGLQAIASNFISGLIILFEGPIKVGDRIEVGEVVGDVIAINARATTVLTNDNIAIIVPNESFISSNVTNWSHNDRTVRFKIRVGVAYGSDTRLVERLLLQAAATNPSVLKKPEPLVRFMEFGDSSLNFELRVFTQELMNREGRLRSELNFAIDDLFREYGVQIPYPQRDIHIKSMTRDPGLEAPHSG